MRHNYTGRAGLGTGTGTGIGKMWVQTPVLVSDQCEPFHLVSHKPSIPRTALASIDKP